MGEKTNPELKILSGDFWQKLPNNEHIKRALEIAIAGKHKILITISPDIQRIFIEFGNGLPIKVAIAFKCPCGYFMHQDHQCTCTEQKIIKHIKRLKLWTYDIAIEATIPRTRDYEYIGEPFKNAQKRIKGMSSYTNLILDDPGMSLLELAKRKLAIDVEIAARVGRTIANLENSKDIMAHHISEAIQYQTLYSEFK